MHDNPIIALDFSSKEEVSTFLKHFPQEETLFVKVGMELFYSQGPAIIQWLKQKNHRIFLDLKLHDIPNTVEKAMKALAVLEIDMVNVHAAGGLKMMQAAKKGLKAGVKKEQRIPTLIAVTQLTSMSEKEMQQEQGIQTSLKESVLHYARLTKKAELDGVVCSAFEAQAIKEATATDFICVTPGIRPITSNHSDQKRVVTPEKAQTYGSTYIVVGRPITQAKNPYEAYKKIKEDWNRGEAHNE